MSLCMFVTYALVAGVEVGRGGYQSNTYHKWTVIRLCTSAPDALDSENEVNLVDDGGHPIRAGGSAARLSIRTMYIKTWLFDSLVMNPYRI